MRSEDNPRHQQPSGLNRFHFGVPYYPEHWSDADRAHDPQRMADAGVNVVRMGEFAWDRLEPEPGRFDFSLFDETIERLGAAGIDTIFCTPTASPPRWLTRDHDDWLRIDQQGRRMAHGSRQHCCTTNEGFRAESRRITEALAEHFADHPRVVGWQTDNEFHCHFSLCYCDACRAGFQRWLAERYGDTDTLNRAWGTAFWAQTYDAFADVPPPFDAAPTHPNPTHVLDYSRFTSDAVSSFQQEQVDILRAANPRWWITHNGLFDHIDYWGFTEPLDFLSVDIYPGFGDVAEAWGRWAAVKLQRCRAATGGFLVPEQQTGPGGQRPYLHHNPRPGRMRLWAWQSVAHGADGILHFRWRTCRFGAEAYWCGVLDHDNVPRRRYDEFTQEGREFARVGPRIVGTVQDVEAAVLIEQPQEIAHDALSLGLPDPADQAEIAFGEFRRRRLATGLVDARDRFDGLKLIVLPSLPLIDDELAGRLRRFVEAGGVLVVTARSATRDRNNHVLADTPPGPLADLCGVRVAEFGPLASGEMTIDLDGEAVPSGPGYEVLEPASATESLATWRPANDGAPHAAAGCPAITHHRVGDGSVIYLGTYFDDTNATALLESAISAAHLRPLCDAAEGVEVTRRTASGRAVTFLLNHTPRPQTTTALPVGVDLLAECDVRGKLELAPFGVAVVEHDQAV